MALEITQDLEVENQTAKGLGSLENLAPPASLRDAMKKAHDKVANVEGWPTSARV